MREGKVCRLMDGSKDHGNQVCKGHRSRVCMGHKSRVCKDSSMSSSMGRDICIEVGGRAMM